MTYSNQHHDSISTVQLSPFGEEQWNRIVTYSPIYVHWTDMIMTHPRRANRPTSGALNLIGHVDLNALKLEDELLLNELHDMRRVAALPTQGKKSLYESKVIGEEQDQQTVSPPNDYQTSSSVSHESKEPVKHHTSYVETSFAPQPNNIKRSALSHQNIPSQVNSTNQTKTLPHVGLGSRPQHSLSVQLRQSTISREHALSASNDHRSSSPLSITSSKRTATSAHSNQRYHYQQQQPQYRPVQSPSSNERDASASLHEQLTGESAPVRRPRTRNANSSRSSMHMLKTKNDRTRQKQSVELRTLLVEPWKQASWSDEALDESIPNSLEIMHKMCGPATPFERNLRRNYHQQLHQFRTGSMKP